MLMSPLVLVVLLVDDIAYLLQIIGQAGSAPARPE
jgi:hypothetical protein